RLAQRRGEIELAVVGEDRLALAERVGVADLQRQTGARLAQVHHHHRPGRGVDRLPIARRFAGHVQVAADLRPTGVAEPRPGRSGPACLVSPAGARSIGLPGAVRLVALEPGHAPAVPVHLRLRRERLDLLRDGLVEGEGFTGDDTEQAAHGAGPAFVEDGTGTGRAVGA